MPEPLKNLLSGELIALLSKELKRVYEAFDSESFQESVFNKEWEQKELKARMEHISVTLHDYLPDDYKEAVEVLKSISSQSCGFGNMCFSGFVELYGLDEYDVSISALEHFTKNASSEFAVRPFIRKYPDRMMAQMEKWAESDNHHVRRLASEGCRPRLPWAGALPEFKKDPAPVLKVLEKLKDDESEYVRRSVANNLNDISKDNPQVTLGAAKKWMGKNPDTDRLIKHACRSLLKQAHPEVLVMFGFGNPDHLVMEELKVQKLVRMEEYLDFSFILKSRENRLGKLRIEYAVDFMKKNGKQARKLFKISESDFSGRKKAVKKRHSFKRITTRKYYTGTHGLAIIVNGKELACDTFELAGFKDENG
jgi:3-methyladenine DNA glycosylase AlkC